MNSFRDGLLCPPYGIRELQVEDLNGYLHTFGEIPCTEEERTKLAIAACFHDIGLWSDHTVDYIPLASIYEVVAHNNSLKRTVKKRCFFPFA